MKGYILMRRIFHHVSSALCTRPAPCSAREEPRANPDAAAAQLADLRQRPAVEAALGAALAPFLAAPAPVPANVRPVRGRSRGRKGGRPARNPPSPSQHRRAGHDHVAGGHRQHAPHGADEREAGHQTICEQMSRASWGQSLSTISTSPPPKTRTPPLIRSAAKGNGGEGSTGHQRTQCGSEGVTSATNRSEKTWNDLMAPDQWGAPRCSPRQRHPLNAHENKLWPPTMC